VKDIKSKKCPAYVRNYKECKLADGWIGKKTKKPAVCWDGAYYEEHTKLKSA